MERIHSSIETELESLKEAISKQRARLTEPMPDTFKGTKKVWYSLKIRLKAGEVVLWSTQEAPRPFTVLNVTTAILTYFLFLIPGMFVSLVLVVFFYFTVSPVDIDNVRMTIIGILSLALYTYVFMQYGTSAKAPIASLVITNMSVIKIADSMFNCIPRNHIQSVSTTDCKHGLRLSIKTAGHSYTPEMSLSFKTNKELNTALMLLKGQ